MPRAAPPYRKLVRQTARLPAFTPTALLLFATGPRPLCRRIPLTELRQTQYNTIYGELVFAPASVPVRAVALPPLEAARALAQLGRG